MNELLLQFKWDAVANITLGTENTSYSCIPAVVRQTKCQPDFVFFKKDLVYKPFINSSFKQLSLRAYNITARSTAFINHDSVKLKF